MCINYIYIVMSTSWQWANQLPMATHISFSGRYPLTTPLSSTVRRWCSSGHRVYQIAPNLQNSFINSLLNATPSRVMPCATFLMEPLGVSIRVSVRFFAQIEQKPKTQFKRKFQTGPKSKNQ